MKLLMVRSSSTTRIKRFSLICFLLHGKAEAEDRSALRVISGGEEAAVGSEEIHFTQNEFKILELLCLHAGKVLTYDFILKHVWGPYEGSNNQILRVNMANIRRKLKENPSEPKYILTELGIGYRMLEDS